MTARLLAFLVWAAVAATAVFWGLRLLVGSPEAPPHAVAAPMPSIAHADLSRLLGADQAVADNTVAPTPASSRFKLIGVVAPKAGAPSRIGVALIRVDDKPARPFRVGSVVDDGLVVQAVQPRRVVIGPRGAPAEVELELPGLEPAATGGPAPVFPSAVTQPDATPAEESGNERPPEGATPTR